MKQASTHNGTLPERKKIPIIVIGASAGGLHALSELVSQLDEDLHAAIFIVLHLSEKSVGGYLVYQLQRHTSFICKLAENDEEIQARTIYIAGAGQHLLVGRHRVIIGHGPRENRWRPSIDVMFRSAAASHRQHVTGIILSGLLDDGTAGMLAIKKSGGICIVQDPNEAEFPDMPLSVLDHMDVDHCVSLSAMGETIRQAAEESMQAKEADVPHDIAAEAAISEKVATGFSQVEELGLRSGFICPDCGGGLWELSGDRLHRYRCHIGHSYSEKQLGLRQDELIEATLWMALRMMEERKGFMQKISGQHKRKGFGKTAAIYDGKIEDIDIHIERMKGMLFDTQKNED
jgi:two-component system chemotaxis response regulator CheB